MTQPIDPIDEIAHQQNEQADREAEPTTRLYFSQDQWPWPPTDGHWIVSMRPRPSGWWLRCECARIFRGPGGPGGRAHVVDAWAKHAYEEDECDSL